MSFIRTKEINGNKYLYLVKNKREGGTVKQEVIQYIGPAGSTAPEDIKDEYRKNLGEDQLDKLGTTEKKDDEDHNREKTREKPFNKIESDLKSKDNFDRAFNDFKENSKQYLINHEDVENVKYLEIPDWLAEKKGIGTKVIAKKETDTDNAILLKGGFYLKKVGNNKVIEGRFRGDTWIPKSEIEKEEKIK